jgi:O-antigen/teichoic acid export membrane protein
VELVRRCRRLKKLTDKFSINQYKKMKAITSDMILNIIATVIPIIIMQFFLLPKVAETYDKYQYGLMITLISLITLSVQPFSSSLSNSRLLLNQKYKDKGFCGDFNILLIGYSLINIIVMIIGTYLYEGDFNFVNVSLILVISIIQIIRKYLLVSFRLRIYYKGILYSNIILIIGYSLGMVLFLFTDTWQLIFITGETLSLIYVITKTKLLKEPIKFTPLFKGTTKYGLVILVASFLGTATSNFDRLLLYPMLGAGMVTIYFVSTLFGKIVSMLVGPISNVILTYLSKMKKFEIGSFKLMLTIAGVLGVISYALIILISEPILTMLYPLYVKDAMQLIYITTLTAMVVMISNVTNTVILKFCNIAWQVWSTIICIAVYLILAFYLVDLYGIYGFCWAALISELTKLLILVLIYMKNHNNLTSENEQLK